MVPEEAESRVVPEEVESRVVPEEVGATTPEPSRICLFPLVEQPRLP